MTTITGKLENAAGETLHARIDFISKSTPLAGAGVVTTNTDKSLRSNPQTGEFSVTLAPGNYRVEINSEGLTTAFDIAVPEGDATVSIEQVVSSPLAYPFVAPNTVWNGIRAGHITFAPMEEPPAPTSAPFQVSPGIGHQTGADATSYRVVWLNANGDHTAPGPAGANTPPVSPNNATRIFLPAAPTGATQTYLYRIAANGKYYLHSTVSPLIGTIDDGLSNAQWEGFLNPDQLAPLYNTTAGGVFGAAGGAAQMQVTDGTIWLPLANARIRAAKGIQLYNFETGLWHTLLCSGNPPQLGCDAGEA
jgi:hypothetical protein